MAHHIVVRIMRVLAANRMFVELAGPETKFGPTSLSNTFTLPALRNGIKHCFDLGYRGGAGFPSYIRETNHRAVEDELDCPFQYAFQTKLHCFDWWKEHPREASQFHIGKQEVLLVDIGGGFGHDLMLFRDRCPDTKGRLILQDQSDVIDAIPKGSLHPTIEVIKHDFFKPQPIEGARVYFLKHVLHDWPNPKALIILYNLVAVMKDYSKLIIIENVLPEAGPLPVPTAGLDFILMIGFAAMERTKKQWETLLTEAGLKITGQWVKEDGDGVLEVMLA
ncbi:S-adenosyl-L-methionine-dependent methyltransferase [Penicillium lagena]|uniref:S-adenosyl-L-methionine-dependent methyltransferase n=1 Tax=Penicillium lagena TaxID=94218 RepID=UPI002540A5C4|nr:S-adenosyl-L-methionine-dependent methyltransferase [Penicillium lagena]KAJ5623797.1 S-adenosyl-L-methionine-dependent methyltransferase [Penicillium lagena]